MVSPSAKLRRDEVTVEECFWGYIYTGSPEALIATGHFKLGWFAKEVKPGRQCFKQHIAGREITIYRRTKVLYDAHRSMTEDEQEQKEALNDYRKAADGFNRAMRCLPKTAKAFSAKCAFQMRLEAGLFRETVTTGKHRGGFAFDEESLREIEMAFNDLIAVIEEATVNYSSRDRERCIAALRANYCGDVNDPAARKFIDGLRDMPPSPG